MKHIGIIGSGIVAQTLGKGFIKHGYQVKLGSRDVSKLSKWLEEAGSAASLGSPEEAAQYGELIVLAVKGEVAEKVVGDLAPQLKGKTVIDTTNPIDHTKPSVNGVLPYFTNYDASLMERLQDAAPDARFVKAFNSAGSPTMVNPTYQDGKPTMFICGNNDDARQAVASILTLFGWEAEDMGKAEAARAIEPLCMLWCIPGFANNQWSHAFKLLKK